MATKFDRESFNLLKMTDSGSESVPDHSFEISNQSRNKKKVRLKRWAQFRLVFFIQRKMIKICISTTTYQEGEEGKRQCRGRWQNGKAS